MPKTAKDTPAPNMAGLITTDVAANLLMVTPAWVRRLTTEGWIHKIATDQYSILAVVQGYISYLRDDQRRASQSVSANRVHDARAAEIELRTAERLKVQEAAGHSAAIEAINEIVLPFRADLYAIPARLTADLSLRRKMEEAFDDAFADLGARAGTIANTIKGSAPAAPRSTRKRGNQMSAKPNSKKNRSLVEK